MSEIVVHLEKKFDDSQVLRRKEALDRFFEHSPRLMELLSSSIHSADCDTTASAIIEFTELAEMVGAETLGNSLDQLRVSFARDDCSHKTHAKLHQVETALQGSLSCLRSDPKLK
jgi:hypothetical protein